jgi:hypothetical protein
MTDWDGGPIEGPKHCASTDIVYSKPPNGMEDAKANARSSLNAACLPSGAVMVRALSRKASTIYVVYTAEAKYFIL